MGGFILGYSPDPFELELGLYGAEYAGDCGGCRGCALGLTPLAMVVYGGPAWYGRGR
jgi:hypothetical protein